MPKGYRSRGGRLTAVKTQRHKGPGRQESESEQRERAVLTITRLIHKLTTERSKLNARLKVIAKELREHRRQLKIVLQRGDDVMRADTVAQAIAASQEARRHFKEEDREVRQAEDAIEDGQRRWAETGTTRKL